MKSDPHIRALADLLVGVVLREVKNPRRAISIEGLKCCSTRRRKQRGNYNNSRPGVLSNDSEIVK